MNIKCFPFMNINCCPFLIHPVYARPSTPINVVATALTVAQNLEIYVSIYARCIAHLSIIIQLILICFHSYTATTNEKFVGSSGIRLQKSFRSHRLSDTHGKAPFSSTTV